MLVNYCQTERSYQEGVWAVGYSRWEKYQALERYWWYDDGDLNTSEGAQDLTLIADQGCQRASGTGHEWSYVKVGFVEQINGIWWLRVTNRGTIVEYQRYAYGVQNYP